MLTYRVNLSTDDWKLQLNREIARLGGGTTYGVVVELYNVGSCTLGPPSFRSISNEGPCEENKQIDQL